MPRTSAARLAQELEDHGREFALDPGSAWQAGSPDGELLAAGIHHGPGAAPRRYVWSEDTALTLLDGLPVDPGGSHDAYDAAELARGWDDWVSGLEGQFCAARIDLERGRAELQLDTFGLVPVFVAQRDGGVLASNSVRVIRSLLDLNAPDPLGVSSMVGLGWAASRHTLLRDVRALPGGARHVLRGGGVTSRVHFGPAQIERCAAAQTSAAELAEYMANLTSNAARGVQPVRCALTAGRDSRLVLASVLARGTPVQCYTIGAPTDPDVVWGRELASRFHLPHEVLVPAQDAGRDWTQLASRLVGQTDGLSDFRQLIDYLHPAQSNGIGVRLSGLGGEIGRNGPYDNTITAANLPLLGHIAGLQRRVLKMKADAFRHLMTAQGQAVLDESTDRFFDERLAEGWGANEIADLFFAFERVGCHGATAARRAAAEDDLFSPYCTRRYAEYCLSLSPAQRYVELPYHQLLRRLSPQLASLPFEEPLLAPRAHLAGVRAVRRVARVAAGRLPGRLPHHLRSSRESATAMEGDASPAVGEWFERRLDLMRELFSHDDSPLWELVSRPGVQALMHAGRGERQARLVGLLRVATVFWYFHGPS